MLIAIAGVLYRRRWWVLGTAIVGAVLAAAIGAGVSSRLSPYGANDPATQSVRATDRFQRAAHRQLEPAVIALVNSGDVATAAARTKVTAIARTLAREPGVVDVRTYYDTGDPAMVSSSRRATYVSVYFKPLSDRTIQTDAKRIEAQFAGRRDIALGGVGVANAEVNAQVSHDLAHAELLAIPIIIVLSVLFFRSFVASLLPPLLGGLAIVFTLLALRIVSSFADMSVYALNLVTGLGLGLAIDYSLFMVSRYREEAAVHGFGPEALTRTLATAGRTILFSSITVAIAVAALGVFPQRFLYSMGIAGALVVLLAATLALLVLPAFLAVLGPRVNALSPNWLARAAQREARPVASGFFYRLSQFVMRRPAQVAIAAAVLLVALGIPFAGIRFISATPNVLPASASARQVQDRMNAGFPAHQGDPLDVVAGVPATSSEAAALRTRIAALPDVASVTPAEPAGARDSVLYVVARRAPLSQATKQLVLRIRTLRPAYYLGVAGTTAAYLDLESSLGRHLPIVLAIVVADTLIVLFLFTGSVILPLKAVLMNLLGLSAMLGILVLIFQDGHLQGLLGFQSEGALDATQPIFLFVLGFGLATDYGVFLLSRIKEAHDAGASNADAVGVGLERTGRIVTAAALLFAVAIGAFVTSKIVFIKELGLGTALAVLIDASIIRALLVPSLMALLGDWNWWAPAPLRRLYDRVGLSEDDTGASQLANGDVPPLRKLPAPLP